MTTRKKVTTRKAPARKARAKKAPQKSAFEKLVDSPVGTPIRIANKTFLASLGVISTMQTELEKFQSGFEKKFDELVKDGEKARRRYQKQVTKIRKDVAEEIDDTVEEVKEDVTELKDRIVEKVSAAA